MDALCVLLDCALGIFPVTSYSGVKESILALWQHILMLVAVHFPELGCTNSMVAHVVGCRLWPCESGKINFP